MNWRYLGRRLLQVPPMAVGIVTLTFLLIHLAPGDPILALAGEYGDEAYYEAMRERFGLDRPLPYQLGIYLLNVARGDLGVSFVQGRPALAIVLERLPATLLLAATALLVSTAVGIALGVLSARRAGRPMDLGLRVTSLLGYATPSFWLAQLALLVIAFRSGWFPIQGMTDPRAPATGLAHVLDVGHHLILPALVLAAAELALTTRLVRAGMLEVSRAEYVRTARAKGLPDRRVTRHALRNALLPLATVLGGRVGMFFTGAVLVEIVFAWPGVGRLMLSAAQTRDYPILLAIFLIVSLAVVVANLLTDLVYARLDPRVRHE